MSFGRGPWVIAESGGPPGLSLIHISTAQSAPGPENQAEPPAKSALPQELIVDSDPQMYTYDQMTRDLQAMEDVYKRQVRYR